MVDILQQRVVALEVLNEDVPEDAQEEGARENDDDQLEDFVELGDQESS